MYATQQSLKGAQPCLSCSPRLVSRFRGSSVYCDGCCGAGGWGGRPAGWSAGGSQRRPPRRPLPRASPRRGAVRGHHPAHLSAVPPYRGARRRRGGLLTSFFPHQHPRSLPRRARPNRIAILRCLSRRDFYETTLPDPPGVAHVTHAPCDTAALWAARGGALRPLARTNVGPRLRHARAVMTRSCPNALCLTPPAAVGPLPLCCSRARRALPERPVPPAFPARGRSDHGRPRRARRRRLPPRYRMPPRSVRPHTCLAAPRTPLVVGRAGISPLARP